jgi:Maltokinase N-terminal cap domain
MALVHRSTLTPTKLELLEVWLPNRPWFAGSNEVVKLGSYRFDDPAGEVGIEIMLVESSGSIFQIPLSYRGQPLDGASAFLIGTLDHSVLGQRWVYDGTGDLVALGALVTAILEGGTGALVEVEIDGQLISLPPEIAVRGSGTIGTAIHPMDLIACSDVGAITKVETNRYCVDVARVVGTQVVAPFVLTGSWAGRESATLAGVTPRLD